MIHLLFIGMWLSLVERFVRDEEVAGSNPVIPIFLFAGNLFHGKSLHNRQTTLICEDFSLLILAVLSAVDEFLSTTSETLTAF